MKAISIRQPWAWLIVNGYKDIENRNWQTKYRGRVLIHASKGMTKLEYDTAVCYCLSVDPSIEVPPMKELERGGIIGATTITDCVDYSESPWFVGDYGFVLKDSCKLTFAPYTGQLGFFEVDL